MYKPYDKADWGGIHTPDCVYYPEEGVELFRSLQKMEPLTLVWLLRVFETFRQEIHLVLERKIAPLVGVEVSE